VAAFGHPGDLFNVADGVMNARRPTASTCSFRFCWPSAASCTGADG